MDAKRCDRCGKYFNPDKAGGTLKGDACLMCPNEYRKSLQQKDLCNDCVTSFSAWWRRLENKPDRLYG